MSPPATHQKAISVTESYQAASTALPKHKKNPPRITLRLTEEELAKLKNWTCCKKVDSAFEILNDNLGRTHDTQTFYSESTYRRAQERDHQIALGEYRFCQFLHLP